MTIGYDQLTDNLANAKPIGGRGNRSGGRGGIGGCGFGGRALVVGGRIDASFSSQDKTKRLSPVMTSHEGMDELAARSGGRAFYNTNDLGNAIRAAIDDAKVTYTKGFYAAQTGDEPGPKFHNLRVRLSGHPEVKLRYRSGYWDEPAPPQDQHDRELELRRAAWSPLDENAIPLVGQVQALGAPDAGYRVFITMDAHTLDLREEDGKYTGKLDILFLQKDAAGGPLDGNADSLDLNLRPENYEAILKTGLNHHRDVVPLPGARILEVLVRDVVSGNLGSVSIPVADLPRTESPK